MKYLEPEMQFVFLGAEDVIRTSVFDTGIDGNESTDGFMGIEEGGV